MTTADHSGLNVIMADYWVVVADYWVVMVGYWVVVAGYVWLPMITG